MTTREELPWPASRRPAVLRYAAAIAIVMFATVIREGLDPYLGERAALSLFYPTVMAVAWYGGGGPAALAIVLSYLAGDYYFVAPRGAITLLRGPAPFVARAVVF